ncbi:MAG: hypothetical protein DMG04_12220 [Acidobacteria bacterium]|nr:MAG: hypothetical protein DMG04_12220 [Acidobacteriota bacterium]PYR10798.1 MAG: hypothetical protein DMF99_10800 [Acidobacteriota bacterium]
MLRCASTRAPVDCSSVSLPRCQRAGDRRASPRSGGLAPPDRAAATHDRQSRLPGRHQSGVATLVLDAVPRQTGHAARVASSVGRQARWTYRRRVGRKPTRREIRQLILRIARENPRCGYQRIVGELKGIGVVVSAITVRNVLREEQVGSAGGRSGPSWRQFLQLQAKSLIAVDFFTVWLRRLYVLFFRSGHAARALRRLQRPSRQRVGHAAGTSGHADARRTPEADSPADSGSRSQIHTKFR